MASVLSENCAAVALSSLEHMIFLTRSHLLEIPRICDNK